jgi:hypothetical protein
LTIDAMLYFHLIALFNLTNSHARGLHLRLLGGATAGVPPRTKGSRLVADGSVVVHETTDNDDVIKP